MEINTIQVFEHQSLFIGAEYKKVLFEQKHFDALVRLNELHKNKYFIVGYEKITFKQYVGVIQVDGLTIEILPKIDNDGKNETSWQNALVEMLRITRKLKVQKVGEADINRQQIHLLDIYFEWFLEEVRLLVHQGLIKQYYKETSNVKALKGKLEFAAHIQKNLVHKERFYTTHQVYGKDHLIHQILSKALGIVEKCTKGNYLYGKCKTVQLSFPEVKSISVDKSTFTKVPKSRKTAPYKNALAIARLIILNYSPDVSSGNENMLAILFDMNLLWEEYILACLREASGDKNVSIYGQDSKKFWKNISIRPDIVIEKVEDGKTERFIIDTKWKNIDYSEPSTHDLRQMYVYNEYWDSKKAMLLYPSKDTVFNKVDFNPFSTIEGRGEHHKCALGKISIFNKNNNSLDENIGTTILGFFDLIKQHQ